MIFFAHRAGGDRGSAISPGTIYQFGLFEADGARHTLSRKGVRVRIQEQPFRVLLLLLQKRGEIVTREELSRKLWPDGTHVDFDGSLNVILKKLRAAIDDDSSNPLFIETVPRLGYRFIAPVTVLSSESDMAGIAAAAPTPPGNFCPPPDGNLGLRSPLLRSYLAAVFVLVAAIAVAGIALHWKHSVGLPLQVSAQAPTRKSVAVLGFRNLSGRDDDAWLSTAFSEMLSTELSAGEQLRLVSGQEVADFRGSSPWPQSGTLDESTAGRIGAALNADLLVLGSYTTTPAQVRLDVRLQDVRTGEILKETAGTGKTEDLFHIVSHVGGVLREALGVRELATSDEMGLLASLPSGREAIRFYSLGLARLRESDSLAAKDLLQQACIADPKFSLAHLMLARAWGGLGYDENSKEEARKALDLSSNLARAQQLLVQAGYYDSMADHEKAASAYRVLFELFPDNLDYGLELASSQAAAGHDSQAAATISRLRRLPPPASDDPRIDFLDARFGTTTIPAHLAMIGSAERKAAEQGKHLLYAQARKDECMTLNYSDHPDRALPACQEAYQTFLAAGNRMMAADALRLIGDVEGSMSEWQQALATYQQALAMLEGLGEHYKTGAVMNNMAILLTNQGDLDRAEQLYRQAKANFEEVGDKGNTETALGNLGDLAFLRGKLAAAETLYEQAMAIGNSLDRTNPAYLLSRSADLALVQGRVQDAQRLAQEAVDDASRAQGAYGYWTEAKLSLGEALKAEGNLEGARQQFEEALQIRQRLNSPGMIQESQAELADLDIDEGRPDEAEHRLGAAIDEFEKEKSDPAEASAYTDLSRALLMRGKVEESRDAIQQAKRFARNSPDPALTLPIAIQNARIDFAKAAESKDHSSLDAARTELRSAIRSAKALGYYELEAEARLALGEVEAANGFADARSQLVSLAEESRSHGLVLLARRAEGALEHTNMTVASASPR
jgi:DNA-binding winged helix-turn-helix (wHTH) protein/tetratricopeptide (TPR) repeat protein